MEGRFDVSAVDELYGKLIDLGVIDLSKACTEDIGDEETFLKKMETEFISVTRSDIMQGFAEALKVVHCLDPKLLTVFELMLPIAMCNIDKTVSERSKKCKR